LFADAGLICITAFISPYRADRARARQSCGEAFHEIHLAADLATCESRDPKGLYKKARSGELREFTGISAPYEIPEQPQLAIDTGHESIAASVKKLVAYVERNFPLDAHQIVRPGNTA
jgi:adenylylsulfate kinase-like enzyme